MTLGKITASSQDILYILVRPETGEYMETVIGGTPGTRDVTGTFGEDFQAAHWFDRIIVAMASGGDRDLVMRLYNGPAKEFLHHETVFMGVGQERALHLIFEPLPPGRYFWEIDTGADSVRPYIHQGSSFFGAIENGSTYSQFDFKSKIMYCTDELQERAVAVIGDSIDNGITEVKTGSDLMAVQVGTVEKNVAREMDELNNGGRIFTGSWYVETV